MVLTGCGGPDTSKLPLFKILNDSLVNARKEAVSAQKALAGKDFILLYFSAHWCPPCRQFTPELVKFYNDHQAKGSYEVIFISSDRNQTDMQNYMRDMRMPWLAVAYGSVCAQQLKDHYSGQGIPRLVMLNSDGKIISDSFKGKQYVGPYKVLEDLNLLIAGRKNSLSTAIIAKRYKVSGLASGKGRNLAIINGDFVSKGHSLDSKTVVGEITDKYVEIKVEGETYRLFPEVKTDGK